MLQGCLKGNVSHNGKKHRNRKHRNRKRKVNLKWSLYSLVHSKEWSELLSVFRHLDAKGNCVIIHSFICVLSLHICGEQPSLQVPVLNARDVIVNRMGVFATAMELRACSAKGDRQETSKHPSS